MSDDIGAATAGRSFRNESLEGADFAGKDVRGTDFTGADLRSASFRDAKLGVAPRVGSVMLGLAIIVATGAGVAIGWAVHQMRDRLSSAQWDEVAAGGSIGLTLIVLVVLILWRGFDFAIKAVTVVYVAVLAVNVVANLVWDDFEWLVALRATALIVFVVLAIAVGMLARVVGGVFGAWSIALVAILGGLASGRADGGLTGVVVAVSMVLISKRALRGDERDRTLRRVVHRFVSRWGTRFVDADLTGADFTGADASGSDLRGATVGEVIWDTEWPLPLDLPEDAVPS